MNVFDAVIQAVIQGLTEFLPVSSSGHLSLTQHFLGISGESAILLSIVLHLGTLLAVFVAYYRTIWELVKEVGYSIRDIFTGRFHLKGMSDNRRLLVMLIVATLPLCLFYFIKDPIKGISSDDSILIEGFCFLYTGVILFLSDRFGKGRKKAGDIKAKDAAVIGVFQGIALLPGVSRSGSTIAGGLFCGLTRATAVKFSFLMSIPPILAGALTEFLDYRKSAETVEMLPLIVGFAVAAVVGFLAIKLVRWLVKTNKFKIFAYYTLALGIVVILISIIEAANGGVNIVTLFTR
ncbi:MAG: undecaprenyl-diphosphate phosphatase [Oscillospiraceae bacterium]|nr:undecaprenyl-diphosphate phosphatase [Oscillospiraceae bacterium]